MFSAYSTALKGTRAVRATPAGSEAIASTGAWLIGAGLTVALCLLFMLGMPSATFWAVAGFLLLAWGLWAWKYPLPAFACLVFVWITVYNRAALPVFQVEGLGNRGGVALGDLLWIICFGIWLLQRVRLSRWHFAFSIERVDILLVYLVPYLLLSVLLPILGVLMGGWSPSFAIPGVRHLQWVSLALMSYWAVRTHGLEHLWRVMLWVFVVASIAHTLHALIQLLAPLGVLSSDWLILDKEFAQRFTATWFFYPRTTGLLVNPNSYGLFGAVVLLLLSACLLARLRLRFGATWLLGLSGLWAVLSSASRSAIVGLVSGALVLGAIVLMRAMLTHDERYLVRLAGFTGKVVIVLGIVPALADALLPSHLLERVVLLAGVVMEGAEIDPNAIGRFDLWESALQAYETEFVWGTWVPAGYALKSPVDSYYVSLLVQGTPLYLLVFLIALLGVLWRGWQMTLTSLPLTVAAGLALIAIEALIAASSLTLSPLLETQTLTSFWLLVGAGLAFQ